MAEMDISEIKQKCQDEWVLVEVLEEDKLNRPTKVKLIAHSKNRDDTYKAMKKTKVKHLAHFYTGEIPKKGYAVAFNGSNVKAIVHDLPAKSYVDGLLGLSFLRNFELNINFREGCLELK